MSVHLVTDEHGTWCEAKTEEQTTDSLEFTTCLPCLEALIKDAIQCMMRVAYECGRKKGPAEPVAPPSPPAGV